MHSYLLSRSSRSNHQRELSPNNPVKRKRGAAQVSASRCRGPWRLGCRRTVERQPRRCGRRRSQSLNAGRRPLTSNCWSPRALQCPWPPGLPLNAPGVAGRRKRDGMGLGLLGLAAAAGWPLMKRACIRHGRASLCLVAVPCRRRGGKLSLRSFLVPRCLALAALSLDTSIVTDSSGDNLGSIP